MGNNYMTINQLVYYEQLAEEAFIDIKIDYMEEGDWMGSTQYTITWWMIEISKRIEYLNNNLKIKT